MGRGGKYHPKPRFDKSVEIDPYMKKMMYLVDRALKTAIINCM